MDDLYPEVASGGSLAAALDAVRQSTDETDSPNHRALIEAAFNEPLLRQLYPYETATATEAVTLAVAHLPTDLGPAVAGRYEA
ncbi:DUF6193 family natural product biosynthesis protein [Micromonospora auratinigra]|uniref:DUF6193 family natural product biosynthesis protein n=1 Tax=Micromonospora auratinigra TaxID=261654 RepID=UPI000B82AF16|nr:DUF6193 family natural product biosynthesis protein [Micromonospora auratinigra]